MEPGKRKIQKEEEEIRNWVELPEDIMILIFSKLNIIVVLYYAQFVCSYWRKLTKDPQLFRSVVITATSYLHIRKRDTDTRIRFTEFAMEAVNRSRGILKEVYIENECTNQLLEHIVRSSKNSLRSFRLSSDSQVMDGNLLIELAKRNTLLEEIEISNTDNAIEVIKEIGCCCSNLKCFRFNYHASKLRYDFWSGGGLMSVIARGDLISVIARNMFQLRELHVSGYTVTKDGLLEILECCKNLEYLDLGQCRRPWDLIDEIWQRCEILQRCVDRIKVVKEPMKLHYIL